LPEPLAAVDYLEIAQHFHTVLIDHVPLFRRASATSQAFTLLVDTLYDENVKLICSAEATPGALYPTGDAPMRFAVHRPVSLKCRARPICAWPCHPRG